MKKLLFVALLGLTIAACSKKSDSTVTPDNATTVAGVYTLSYIRFDSVAVPLFGPYNLPLTQNGSTVVSGTLTATRVAADSVKIDAHLVVTGYKDQDYTYGTFGLKQSGTSYTLTSSGQYGFTNQASTIDGKTINIDVSYPDNLNPKVNDRDVLIGKK